MKKKIPEIYPNLYKSDIWKKGKYGKQSISRGESEKGISVYK